MAKNAVLERIAASNSSLLMPLYAHFTPWSPQYPFYWREGEVVGALVGAINAMKQLFSIVLSPALDDSQRPPLERYYKADPAEKAYPGIPKGHNWLNGCTHIYFIHYIQDYKTGASAAGRVPFRGANRVFIAEQAKHFPRGAARIVAHELGHSLNLKHTQDASNLMREGGLSSSYPGREIRRLQNGEENNQYEEARIYGLEHGRFLRIAKA